MFFLFQFNTNRSQNFVSVSPNRGFQLRISLEPLVCLPWTWYQTKLRCTVCLQQFVNHQGWLRFVHGACNANRQKVLQTDYCTVIIVGGTFAVIVLDLLCHLSSFQNLLISVRLHLFVTYVTTFWFLEKTSVAVQ